jgi:AhpD family alkylhydroperoxidase
MQRLKSIEPQQATGRVKQLLDNVQQAFGGIPNTAAVMANSPAVLESFLAFSQAMGQAGIGEKLHTQVKLTSSEANACQYCVSAVSAIATSSGLSADEILAGRTSSSDDRKTNSALQFARSIVEHRGDVRDEELASVREAGFNDEAIVEIVASVVLGTFTNFLNKVAATALDFPEVQLIEICTSAPCSAGAH